MNVLLVLLAISSSWIHVERDMTWIISEDILEVAQQKLPDTVRAAAATQRRALPSWSDYRFQFQGRHVKGRPVIYINAYCDLIAGQSEEEFVLVLDGGTCYFDTTYDPETGDFGPIAFHGEA